VTAIEEVVVSQIKEDVVSTGTGDK
jgi:hypothetical protein